MLYMSKLTELIEKKKERKQSLPTKGSYYSKKEDLTERIELRTKILEFSGFSNNGNDQVQEIKN